MRQICLYTLVSFKLLNTYWDNLRGMFSSEPSVTIDGKIYGLDGDIKRYFCLALKRSRKSQDLVDFLKNYASYPPVSEYIQVLDTFFLRFNPSLTIGLNPQRCERHSAFQDFLQVFKNIFV